jgi:hypothetical protein
VQTNFERLSELEKWVVFFSKSSDPQYDKLIEKIAQGK